MTPEDAAFWSGIIIGASGSVFIYSVVESIREAERQGKESARKAIKKIKRKYNQ